MMEFILFAVVIAAIGVLLGVAFGDTWDGIMKYVIVIAVIVVVGSVGVKMEEQKEQASKGDKVEEVTVADSENKSDVKTGEGTENKTSDTVDNGEEHKTEEVGLEKELVILTGETIVEVLSKVSEDEYSVQIGDTVYEVRVDGNGVQRIKSNDKVYYDSRGIEWEK